MKNAEQSQSKKKMPANFFSLSWLRFSFLFYISGLYKKKRKRTLKHAITFQSLFFSVEKRKKKKHCQIEGLRSTLRLPDMRILTYHGLTGCVFLLTSLYRQKCMLCPGFRRLYSDIKPLPPQKHDRLLVVSCTELFFSLHHRITMHCYLLNYDEEKRIHLNISLANYVWQSDFFQPLHFLSVSDAHTKHREKKIMNWAIKRGAFQVSATF